MHSRRMRTVRFLPYREVAVQDWVSVQGASLSKGGISVQENSLSRGSLSMGVSLRETPLNRDPLPLWTDRCY